MSKGLQITGFARFLLFMLFFVPTVVFGVLYAKHGEEGLSMTKVVELFTGEQSPADPAAEAAELKAEITELEQEIKEREARLRELGY